MSSFATAVGVGLLGVLAGVPARAVIQRLAGPPVAAQAGWRWPGIEPAMGLRWFAVTLRLAGQGLGWAVPAYLALAVVCLVVAVIDAATGLLPNRSTYPVFPVVAGLLLIASLGLGELGRLGRGLLAAGLARRVVAAAGAAVSPRRGGGRPVDCTNPRRPPRDSTAGGRDRHVDSARLRTGQGAAPMASGTPLLHCGAHAWVSGSYARVGRDGEPVGSVQDYLAELLAGDCRPLTLRSSAFDLLDWFRFLAAASPTGNR